jgi:uncharacterized membrane protein
MSPQKIDPQVQKEWIENSKYWKFGFIYYNPEDKRLMPPKRVAAMGWTINFANPKSIAVVLALVLVVWGILHFVRHH